MPNKQTNKQQQKPNCKNGLRRARLWLFIKVGSWTSPFSGAWWLIFEAVHVRSMGCHKYGMWSCVWTHQPVLKLRLQPVAFWAAFAKFLWSVLKRPGERVKNLRSTCYVLGMSMYSFSRTMRGGWYYPCVLDEATPEWRKEGSGGNPALPEAAWWSWHSNISRIETIDGTDAGVHCSWP